MVRENKIVVVMGQGLMMMMVVVVITTITCYCHVFSVRVFFVFDGNRRQ